MNKIEIYQANDDPKPETIHTRDFTIDDQPDPPKIIKR
jgi:hypothetical protein